MKVDGRKIRWVLLRRRAPQVWCGIPCDKVYELYADPPLPDDTKVATARRLHSRVWSVIGLGVYEAGSGLVSAVERWCDAVQGSPAPSPSEQAPQ